MMMNSIDNNITIDNFINFTMNTCLYIYIYIYISITVVTIISRAKRSLSTLCRFLHTDKQKAK